MKMSEEARQARNEYKRAWYQRNKKKVAEYNMRFWEAKAAKQSKPAADEERNRNEVL